MAEARHELQGSQTRAEAARHEAEHAEAEVRQCRKELELLEREHVAVLEQQAQYFEAALNTQKQEHAEILQLAQVRSGRMDYSVLVAKLIWLLPPKSGKTGVASLETRVPKRKQNACC
jgi:hypothetical protein